MTTKQSFHLMLGIVGLTIIAIICTVYFGNNLLVTESNKLIDLKANATVLEQKQTDLAKAKRDINKYQGLEEITQTIIPQDKDQARAVREITTLASESGVELQSISFPASNLGAKVNLPKNQTTNEPAENKKIISQAVPVADIKGVYSLETTIIPKGAISYDQFITLLNKLEKNRRTAQVTRVKIEPKSSDIRNSKLKVALTINIFLKP